MFSYDPTQRPTVDELKNHPWMVKGVDVKGCRAKITEELHESRSAKTATSSTGAGAPRGDVLLELIRETSRSGLVQYQFNDKTDFDIDINPGNIKDMIEDFNKTHFNNQLAIEVNKEKRWIKLVKEDKETPDNTLIVKMKFFRIPTEEEPEEGEPVMLRMRMIKKRGNLMEWYEILDDIKEKGQLQDFLLTTENQVAAQ